MKLNWNATKTTDYNDPIGDIYSLWEFLDMASSGSIMPSDGCIGCIMIDGYDTDLFNPIWMIDWVGNKNIITMKDLCDYAFETGILYANVQIRWCNK
jgi:hypothetical protein